MDKSLKKGPVINVNGKKTNKALGNFTKKDSSNFVIFNLRI